MTKEQSARKLSRTDTLLESVRAGARAMSRGEQAELTARLALPAMLANLSSIVMEYIDASMVGHLGADASASIGLVATTTWLFFGLGNALSTGFAVQVAHRIGAGDAAAARGVLRQSFVVVTCLSLLLAVAGVCASPRLPLWLGGSGAVAEGASSYFMVFSVSIPLFVLNYLMSSMLRCSGNVKVPSLLYMLMCLLDVVFNFLMIYPDHHVRLGSVAFSIPGADLGVTGAAIGTLLAELVVFVLMAYFLCFRSLHLSLLGMRQRERNTRRAFRPTLPVLRRAVHIGMPIALERTLMSGAQIATTVIVAPLGVFAIAANAFGVTAESLCYMPGYGFSDAATTLVGQSVGARRTDLARRFAALTVGMGVGVMTVMGTLLYIGAPLVMGLFSPVPEIIALGTDALRIEAFAEPLFAVSIVGHGVMVGAGSALVPSCVNLTTIWAVRITLALALAPVMGLNGVWLAMCIELNVRGIIYLARLKSGRWIPKALRQPAL